ncbi:phage baseplate assembly protein V [Paraburkholderia sp.]|uniref:phage baseplate assembly protein V n=1 Tax=Paraburkholderia sp. TaxID=1926495 RepID=UPI003D6EA618
MVRSDDGPATGGVKFKTGIVSDIDMYSGSVKVSFADVGVESGWLTVCYPKTLEDKAYWMLDVGEHVRCIMDEYLEDGAVLGAIYSSADAVPWASADRFGWTFKDGGGFSYDRSTGELDITSMGAAKITIGGDAQVNVTGDASLTSGGTTTVKATETVIDGNLRVKGASMFEGGIGGAAGASTTIPGSVKAQDDVIAGDISLTGHGHTDSMNGRTSAALPSI